MSRVKCCRCGAAPRHGDTYLCPECHISDATAREREDAERKAPQDHRRLYLMHAHGWAGGWPRKDAAVHVS